jgi:hypothetical protein
MKKFLFLSMMLLMAISAISQVKKVAILETIDKEGNINYGVKLMVRSNLTKSVSNATGYEGYDRVNMSQIMGEQDFQRTGMVNEEQIKRLGELSGADYIIVSEVAKVSETNIVVTASILNVETAQTIGADYAMMTTTAEDIQHGCESLANRLLGLPDPYANEKSVAENKKTESPVVVEEEPKEEPRIKPEDRSKVGDLKIFSDGTQGIVFYMDQEGKGLAVSLDESEMVWDASNNYFDINTLKNLKQDNHGFYYGEGKTNTQKIIQYLGSNAYAANWCFMYGDDWYLPSVGEMYYLVINSKKGSLVANSLKTNGGGRISGWYWTSSEHDRQEALNVSDGGTVHTEDKDEDANVRAIRAFKE